MSIPHPQHAFCVNENTTHAVVKGCQEETERCQGREDVVGVPCESFSAFAEPDNEKPLGSVHEFDFPRRPTPRDNSESSYLAYRVDVDRPLTGKPLRSGDLLLLCQENKVFQPVRLTLCETGMLVWHKDGDNTTQTFAWSPFSMVWAYRLTEVEQLASGHLDVLPFKVSIFHIGMGFIFAVDDFNLPKNCTGEIVRAQWVADISRTLRYFTKSLFPPFHLSVEPVDNAWWTRTRLLAGYMLLCKKDGVCVLYCELHSWNEDSARFVAYEDATCQHVVFTSQVGMQTLISERLASDCSCFVIDGHNFSTRTSNEKVLWLRVLANVKVKIRNGASAPTAAELEECRLAIREKHTIMQKSMEYWDAKPPLLPYAGKSAQAKRDQLVACGGAITRPHGSKPATSVGGSHHLATFGSDSGAEYKDVEVVTTTLNAGAQMVNRHVIQSQGKSLSIGIAQTSTRQVPVARLEEITNCIEDDALLLGTSLSPRHDMLEPTSASCEILPCDGGLALPEHALNNDVPLACKLGEYTFENDELSDVDQDSMTPAGHDTSSTSTRCDLKTTEAQAIETQPIEEHAENGQLAVLDAMSESCAGDSHSSERLQSDGMRPHYVPSTTLEDSGRCGGDSSVGNSLTAARADSERIHSIAPDKSHRKQPPVIGSCTELQLREALNSASTSKPNATADLQTRANGREHRPRRMRNSLWDAALIFFAWCWSQ